MQSSILESVLLADYQFALKCFINKDIARSFGLVSKLQPAVYESISRDLASEETFVKITTLYLTEVGLLLKLQGLSGSFQLNIHDKQMLVGSLRKNEVLDQISNIYGTIETAPLELIFQVYLVYYTCREAIQGDSSNALLQSFTKLYHTLEFKNREKDRYLKRWFDLFVLNVLPDADEFASAFAIAETNETFGGPLMVSKLKVIQESKKQEKTIKEKEKKVAQAQEAKRLAAERERQKQEQYEKSLKYRSLKQIRADQETHDRSENIDKTPASVPRLTHMMERLGYYYTLSKNVLRGNSPVILVVVVLLLISGHTLRKRKIDLKQKLKDTLLMAFTVTYL